MIRAQSCPVCGKDIPAGSANRSSYFPFCCERCQRIDFFRWSEGKYAIVEPLDPNFIEPEAEIDSAEEDE